MPSRVYRKALTPERVLPELHGGRATQWHAVAVDALLGMIEEDRRAVDTVALRASVAI